MEVVTVEIKDKKAFRFLKDLETLDVLKIVKSDLKLKPKTKIADRLAGSITPEQAALMYQELEQMRGEWDRNI